MIQPVTLPPEMKTRMMAGYQIRSGELFPETFIVPSVEKVNMREYADDVLDLYGCESVVTYGHWYHGSQLVVGSFPSQRDPLRDEYLLLLWSESDFTIIHAETVVDYYEALEKFLPVILKACEASRIHSETVAEMEKTWGRRGA